MRSFTYSLSKYIELLELLFKYNYINKNTRILIAFDNDYIVNNPVTLP